MMLLEVQLQIGGGGGLWAILCSINFFIEGRICYLLIKKGSYENMESPEILNKQELKHQQKLSCLNKGDEIRVSRGCYSILCEEVVI